MTHASAWLVIAGIFNLWVSVLIGYTVYWRRASPGYPPASRAGITAHQTTLWNGFLLLSLSIAIDQTAFSDQINLQLAVIQVAGTLISSFRSIYAYRRGYDDLFILKSQAMMRFLGLGHILDLLALAGILYGVARSVFL